MIGKHLLKSLASAWALVHFLASDAHAYIDPGTGSFFLQIFLASLFGALFAMKRFGRQIVATVRARFRKRTVAAESVVPSRDV